MLLFLSRRSIVWSRKSIDVTQFYHSELFPHGVIKHKRIYWSIFLPNEEGKSTILDIYYHKDASCECWYICCENIFHDINISNGNNRLKWTVINSEYFQTQEDIEYKILLGISIYLLYITKYKFFSPYYTNELKCFSDERAVFG